MARAFLNPAFPQAYLGSESDEDGLPEQKKLSNGARYRQLLTGSAADAAELVSEPPRVGCSATQHDVLEVQVSAQAYGISE